MSRSHRRYFITFLLVWLGMAVVSLILGDYAAFWPELIIANVILMICTATDIITEAIARQTVRINADELAKAIYERATR